MHGESNICRYVIFQKTVSERSVRICRWCAVEVVYMLKGVMCNGIRWSYDIRRDYG